MTAAVTRWVDGQYALDRPELGLSNWEHGRLFARGGVLSGDSVYTIPYTDVSEGLRPASIVRPRSSAPPGATPSAMLSAFADEPYAVCLPALRWRQGEPRPLVVYLARQPAAVLDRGAG